MAIGNKTKEIEKYLKNLIEKINKKDNIHDSIVIIYKDFLDKNNSDFVIQSIQKTGFFRPSKYNFDIKTISLFLTETIYHPNFKKFSKYLFSIHNLFLISKKTIRIYNRIKSFILSEDNLVKYFFAKADNLFYKNSDIEDPEFILECISFLILESKKNKYTNGINISLINKISNKDYTELLELSKKIIHLKRIEIKIDFFQYALEKTSNKNYKLTNESFEKNMSMSYIRYDQQRSAIHKETLDFNQNVETFEKLVTKILEDSDINLFGEVRELPYRRICPKIITNNFFIKIFTTDHIYLEEKSQLNFFFLDNFLPEEYLERNIYKNFNIFDIIKLQRIFNFISITYRIFLKKSKKVSKDKDILLSSVIPIANEKFFNELLDKTLNTDQKNFFELIQKLISTNFYNLNDFFDIQYTPILSLGNDFLISPTILAKSNLIRSILIKENTNLAITTKGDKMIQNLEEDFRNLGFSIATEVKLGLYEIDIIAKKGNDVFIFECKNSYHPVNEFELRNSFAQIQKASSQLDNLKKMINDKSTRKNLAKKIGFSLYNVNFHFSIILSNRMFNGYVYNGYRCINSYFLNNLLNEGLIKVNSDNYSLWQASNFNENDLINIINGEFISDYELLAHENFLNLIIEDITISSQRFGFIPNEIIEHIDKTYRKL